MRTLGHTIHCFLILLVFNLILFNTANAQTVNPDLYTVELTATSGTIHVGDSFKVNVQVYYDDAPLAGNASNYVGNAQFSSSDDSVVSFGTQLSKIVEIDGSGIASVTATTNKAGTVTIEALVPIAIPLGRSEDGPHMLDSSVTVTVLPLATPKPTLSPPSAPATNSSSMPTPPMIPTRMSTPTVTPKPTQTPAVAHDSALSQLTQKPTTVPTLAPTQLPAQSIQAPIIQPTPIPTGQPMLTQVDRILEVEPTSAPETLPNATVLLTTVVPSSTISATTQQPTLPSAISNAMQGNGGFNGGMLIGGAGVAGVLALLVIGVIFGNSMRKAK